MFKLRPNTLLVTLFALLAFSKGTIAQDREKIKADLIFKMLDFDARFRMIPGYRDSACRMDLANQVKTEYLDFKQTYQANTALFAGNERDKINEVIKSSDKILLVDEVFNSLKQPDYLSDKNPSKGEVMDRKWIDIHKACLYVLIKDLVVRSNYDLFYEFSRLAAAADVARNGKADCRYYADSLLNVGGPVLNRYYQAGESQNSPESNSYLKALITAFKNKAADLPEQTKALYERRNVLVLSPASEEADIHLKTLYPITSLYLNGLIKELQETDKYTIISPVNQSDLLASYSFFQTKAHRAGKQDTPDYTIRIVTPGVTGLHYNTPLYYEGFNRTGYIAIMTYRCPVKMEIVNKEGKVERTFVATDENDIFSDTLHANILGNLRPGAGLISFRSLEECQAAMDDPDLKNNIANILLSKKWNDVAPVISATVNSGYGYPKIFRDFYAIYGLSNAKSGHQEIADIVDSTDYAINNLGSETLRTSCKATLSRMLEKYQEILKRPDISHNMRVLCMRNSVQAAMLSDQLERMLALIEDYRKVNPGDSYVPAAKLYIFSHRYWLMKNNASTVKLPPYTER